MAKLILKFFICISILLLLCSCTSRSYQFYIVSDYDYFMDAGDMGFYKKGDLYGFVHLNGDAAELEPFTLDENLSESINLESIKCLNGIATFTTIPSEEEGIVSYGFMDLHGNVVMKEEWEAISSFSSSGYASAYDIKLDKYIIIDKNGRTIRDSQSYIEFYPPNPDIFICRNTFDVANSFTGYYVLDKDLNLLLDNLEVYYYSGPELALTRQYTIFGDSNKFIYKKNNHYYIYQIDSNKTVSEYSSYADLLKYQKEFIDKCHQMYVDYEYPVMTESYNGVFIHYNEYTDTYSLTNKDGHTLFEPGPDITGLTYLKGKVIQGVSRTTGKTVVIFNKDFK